MDRMTFTSLGLGTNSHVLFSIRALNSSNIAFFQLVSRIALTESLGIGEMLEVVMVAKLWKYLELGLEIPFFALVVIEWE